LQLMLERHGQENAGLLNSASAVFASRRVHVSIYQ
jgi:hypothetical protein